MAGTTIEQLRTRVTGRVVQPGDDSYEDARRVYNFMIDRHPRVIVRCAGVTDVVAAVDFARNNELDLAVRGGAHSVPGFGTCDDGVVVDLSGMREVRVDPTARTADAAGGATWGDFNDATYAHGLATTGGIISTTGVTGLTLGGGIGYLDRRYGLSCDNLDSAEVVMADGRVVVASQTENPDLLWALRGGGGNFGVVTSARFRLHPVRDVYAGPVFFEMKHAADILAFFREFIADAPEEYGGFPAFQIAPPLPFIPEQYHGHNMIGIISCWSGPMEQGEKALAPLRDLAPIVADQLGPMPYPVLNGAFDALVPRGLQHYWKAAFVKELTDEAIAAHMEHAEGLPAVNSTVHLYPINGACHRVAPDATAFAFRDATFATVIAGMWPDPADNDANTRWVRDYYAAIAPHSEPGGYVNFMAGDDQGRVADNYRQNYDRLVDVKRAYDPGNLFHLNQNIRP